MGETMTGGCQCGRVRYAVEVEDFDACACHCRMCQRATGNVFVALKTVPQGRLRWTGAAPDEFTSSPFARRGFCRECGTPLTFAYTDSETIDLTVASFDDPGRFVPTSNFGIESRQAHWRRLDHLPSARADEYQPLTDRWIKHVGKLPD